MTARKLSPSRVGLLVGLSLLIPAAQASFIPIALPNAGYTSGTTLLPITGSDGETTNSLSDANLTVSFSATLQKFIGSWGTWGIPPAVETSNPAVLAPAGPEFQSITSVTFTFSAGLSTFGMEVEPDAFTQGFFPVSVQFFNGASLLGTINNSMDGSTAALFAASSDTPITRAVLTIAGNANLPNGTDPAVAQLRYALTPTGVPEPAAMISCAIGLGLLAGIRRFRAAQN